MSEKVTRLEAFGVCVRKIVAMRYAQPQNDHFSVAWEFIAPEQFELSEMGAALKCSSIHYAPHCREIIVEFSEPLQQVVAELPDYEAVSTVDLILMRAALKEFPEDALHLIRVKEILRSRGIG